ncbi:MAG: methyltransferase domain-containing protein [Methanomicrobia archaeon]|nr:methyltransferase domain-containing protein [Methanomicrobia archaeon]
MNKEIYFYYSLIAVLYPLVKVICYINGLVYLHGVVYGLIAGVSTISVGILALKEYDGANKPVWHWLAALIPLIVIPLTPIIMILHLGLRTFLMEKMTIFMIFEGIAVAQFILAILMFRGLIFKRGTDKQKMPGIGFAIMKTVLTLRSLFKKPERTLREMGLQKGQTLLDYGCGIGSFCIPAAKMVGDDGVVYALDIHPLAIRTIERKIKKRKIANIKTILSDRETGLPDESVDVVLLYDVLQMVSDKDKLLDELHRVLKSGGILFATAEHLDLNEFMNIFAKEKLFTLAEQRGEVFMFKRD